MRKGGGSSAKRTRVLGLLALVSCLLVVGSVFFTAYQIGASSSDPRRSAEFILSEKLLATKNQELTVCLDRVKLLDQGDVPLDVLLRELKDDLESAKESLKLENDRLSTTRQELEGCKKNREDMQRAITGATSGNASQRIVELTGTEKGLIEDLEEMREVGMDVTGWTRRELEVIQLALLHAHRHYNTSNSKRSLCRAQAHKYGVVFDIGSTGNRVHVYNFTGAQEGASQSIWDMKLQDELFEINHEALSKVDSTDAAVAALEGLFKKAIAYIPLEAQQCTPVEFKATAGLRKLGRERADAILERIRSHYGKSQLWLKGERPVRILEGREEGPLAWVTVNFLLGNFKQSRLREPTAAIVDLGGGSTQIVFEPKPDVLRGTLTDFVFKASLGTRNAEAYQHSYEGLGLHEATSELLHEVRGVCANHAVHHPGEPRDDDTDADGGNDSGRALNATLMANFPCFAKGYVDPSGVKRPADGDHIDSPFDECVWALRHYVIRDDEACRGASPCAMRGVYQPQLADVEGPIYVFSFVYDLMHTHLKNGTGQMTVGEMAAVGRARCANMTLDGIAAAKPISSSLKPEYECIYYSYVYTLLHHGYGIDIHRPLHIAKKIDGYETAWTLGAALQTLSL